MWCLHQPRVSCVVSSRSGQDRLGGLEWAVRVCLAGVEQKSGDNMAPQYLLVTKKHKNLLPAEGMSAWLPGTLG